MPVWMKKMLFLSVALTAMYLCVGWGTAVTPIDPLYNSVTSATVNPLYQLACPSDSGIPAWECTMWAQANNNFTAVRNGIVSSGGALLGRVVDGGPIVLNEATDGGGLDSSVTGYVNYTPSATATRISGSNARFTYTATGTFTGSEILRCHRKTRYADGTVPETDGGSGNADFTIDGGSSAGGNAFDGTGTTGVQVYPVNGTYITSMAIRCTTDAGTSDVGITFTMHGEEM